MKEDLLDHTDGLRIAKTRADVVCAYSGDTIPKSTNALIIRSHRYDTDTNTVDDKTYSTWVSLKYRDELRETLDQFDFSEATPRADVSPTGFIGYSTSKGNTNSCPMCQNQVPRGTDAVVFRNRTNPDREQTAWCHVRCLPTLCGGLGNIDDYKTEIVAKQI